MSQTMYILSLGVYDREAIDSIVCIAVGMATNIPPHSLGEVIDALTSICDQHNQP